MRSKEGYRCTFHEEFLSVVFRLSSASPLVSYYGSCIVFATLVWLAKAFIWKYTLRLLLNYHSWMYESRGPMSLKTKLWLVGFPSELYMYMNFWSVRKYLIDSSKTLQQKNKLYNHCGLMCSV